MAEEKEIILSVDTGQAESRLAQVQRQITELTKAQKELKKQYDAGKVSAEDYAVANETYAKGLALLKGEYKTLTAEATKNVSVNASLGDSYNEISARLSQAQKSYKALSKTQREASEGKELLKNIQKQKQALKDLDAEMGDFQRNVGNYPKAMAGAFGPLDRALSKTGTSVAELATGGFPALKAILVSASGALIAFGKALLGTPLGWALLAVTALIGAFAGLASAIKTNDQASTSFGKLFATLRPIIDGVKQTITDLTTLLGKCADAMADFFASFSDSAKEAQKLITDMDKLQDRERELSLSSAENAKKVSELRAKVAEKDKYTAEERQKYLEEAQKLEKKILDEQIAVAKERIRIEEENNNKKEGLRKDDAKRQDKLSDEAKDRETKLKVELIQLETNYNNKMREFSAQRVEIKNQITATEKAQADAEARAQKERTEQAKKQWEERKRILAEELAEKERIKTLEVEIADALENQLLANMQEGVDKQKALKEKQYNDEIEQLKAKYASETKLSQEAQDNLNALLKAKKELHDAEMDEIDANYQAQQVKLVKERAETIGSVEDEIYNIRKEAGLVKEEEQRRHDAEKYEQELEELRTRLEGKGVAEEEINRLIAERRQADAEAVAQAEIELARKTAEEKAEIEKQQIINSAKTASADLNSFGEALEGIGELANAFAKSDEERAKNEKILALAKVAISTGIAIAEGVANAAAAGPFPLNLAAITTTIATVATNMATALTAINGAKFATGGIVGGTSYTGDNVPVFVNSGEMILNKAQQAQLFDLANGYGASNMEALAGALAYAVSRQPAPVLVYEEFNNFAGKTAKINEMTTIQ